MQWQSCLFLGRMSFCSLCSCLLSPSSNRDSGGNAAGCLVTLPLITSHTNRMIKPNITLSKTKVIMDSLVNCFPMYLRCFLAFTAVIWL
jgi:hypothetical protein